MRLKYLVSRTINLGNYESVKIEIGIEDTTDPANKNTTFRNLHEWVEANMNKECGEIEAQLKANNDRRKK